MRYFFLIHLQNVFMISETEIDSLVTFGVLLLVETQGFFASTFLFASI